MKSSQKSSRLDLNKFSSQSLSNLVKSDLKKVKMATLNISDYLSSIRFLFFCEFASLINR